LQHPRVQESLIRERIFKIRSLSFLPLCLLLAGACATGGPPRDAAGDQAVDPDSLATAGRKAAAEGDYALAKEMFDAALEADTGHADSYRGLARISLETSDPVSALYYYEILVEQPDAVPSDYIGLARTLTKMGRSDEALTLLTEAAAAHPDDADLSGELAMQLLEQGQTEKGLRQLWLAVDLGAGKAAHKTLARELFELGRYDAVEDVLRSYNDRYPGDFEINMKLAYIYFSRGEYRDALPFYRAAVDANPASIDARVGLAQTLEQLGRIDNAIRVYDDALEMRGLTREMEPVILAQANLLIRRGKYTRSLRLVEAAAQAFPETPGLACASGMALAGEGRYDEALSAFSRATGDPKWSEFADAQIRRIQSMRR
jgi:tetratricopeptide (TPR) repeat protein